MAVGELGKWLTRQRGKRRPRMTQAALADALDTSRSWVSSIERGALKRPKVEDCALLADYFGVPLKDVLGMAGYTLAEISALGSIPRQGSVAEQAGIYLTTDELEALLQRAASAAVRQVLDEREGGHGG